MNLIRKTGLSAAESARRVSHDLAWTVIDNDSLLLTAAFAIQARWQLNYWDSLIIAAAQRAGTTQLWCVRSIRCGDRDEIQAAGGSLPADRASPR